MLGWKWWGRGGRLAAILAASCALTALLPASGPRAQAACIGFPVQTNQTCTNSAALTNTSTLPGVNVGLRDLGTLTVTNTSSGTITGTGFDSIGIRADVTANVTNSGSISGQFYGIVTSNGIAGTANVTNSGSISGTEAIRTATANVTNSGSILGSNIGIDAGFSSSGNVNVINSGTIIGTNNYGIITNTANVTNSGSISGADLGIEAQTATVTNSGRISGGDAGIRVVFGPGTANVTNSGTITGGNSGSSNSGIDAQTATVTNSGSISGGDFGIRAIFGAGAANVTNSGTITGGTSGIFAGTVNLTNSGSISGGTFGIRAGTAANVTNSGTISGGNTGISSGATVNVINSGTISGNIGIRTGTASGFFTAANVTNSGTIIGTGGTALMFSGEADTLTLLPGSKIIGAINLAGGGFGFGGDTVNFRGGNHNLTFDTLTGATVTGTTPFAVSGNQAAAIDPTPFAMTDRTLMDFTRGVSSALGDRFGDMAVAGSNTATAFAPQSNVSTQADDAFAGIPGLSAYAGDAMVFKNPTVQYADGSAVWARGFAGQRVQQADGVLLHTLNQFYGGMIGGDWQVQPNLRLGAFLGAGKTRSTVDLNSGDSDSDLVFGGVFGRYDWGASFLSVALQGGHSHTSTTRNINNNLAPGGLETATASYDGWYVNPEATVGHNFALGSLAGASYTLTPSLQVRYLYGWFGGYTESGSTANLTVGSRAVADFEERGQLKLTRTQIFAPS